MTERCRAAVFLGDHTYEMREFAVPDAPPGVDEGDRVAVNEILMAAGPLRLYGYSDMRGDGEVGLWGGYGEYMEIFPGTELLRMSSTPPAEHLTLFEPLASAVHWV